MTAVTAIGALLSGCAASYSPMTAGPVTAPDALQRDLADCRAKVDRAARAAGKAGTAAAVGGAVGAAEGAAAGAFMSAAGDGSLIGLAIGLTIGLIAAAAAASERDPALDACMFDKGYRPAGA
jgi:hypothetical protein